MRCFVIIFAFTIGFSSHLDAQNPYNQIKSANEYLDKSNFKEAEILFRRALESENPWVEQAMFNLGNSLYRQEKYQEAERFYSDLINKPNLSKQQQAQVWHNKGNSQLKQEMYKESIESYKNSLKLNPDDNDTRFNLSYALRKLQQQQQQQNDNNQQQNQQQNQHQNQQQQNNQEQDKQQDQKQNQEQQSRANNKNESNQDKKTPSESQQISKQDMDRMLNALSNRDKNLLKQLNKKSEPKTRVKPEKDW